MTAMWRALPSILFFIVLAVAGFIYRDSVRAVSNQLYDRLLPCSRPMTYKIGSVDPRFHVTEAEFRASIKSGEDIWERGAKKDLLAYDQENGQVIVSLVYDYRQAAVDKLKGIGMVIDNNQASYDRLRAQYDSLQADYKSRKASFASKVSAYEAQQTEFNNQVQMWNGRGGAPKDVYQQLQVQKDSLNSSRADIEQSQKIINSDVDQINALATTLNGLANTLNINASNYNQIGASTGGEFEEGLYESSVGIQTISIYEYSNKSELIRVLAHELGHALGLEHVDDKNAIMYKLNQSSNDKLTVADFSELTRVCHLK